MSEENKKIRLKFKTNVYFEGKIVGPDSAESEAMADEFWAKHFVENGVAEIVKPENPGKVAPKSE